MARFPATSPYNIVLGHGGQAPPIALREISLRQLGHMEADMTFDEKLYFLARLDDVGVKEVVVWGVDTDASELVTQARERGLSIGIALFGKVYFKDEMRAIMAKARACGAQLVCFVGRGADFSLEVMGWSRGRMREACVEAVKEAKDHGLAISVGLSYATQTDWAFHEEVTGAVVEAGADRLHVPDSLGVASPHAMRTLVSRLRELAPIPIEVHCHNDFGVGVANAVAAVEGGATVVEVIVNGMDPERSGVASLDEVVMTLEMLYGVDTGVKTERLTALAKLHERLTGMLVPVNKPLVGPRAFNYRVASGGRPSEPKRDHFYGSPKVLPFDPAIVGNQRAFMLGKFSGPNEVYQRLSALGLAVSEAQLERLITLVRQRGVATKLPVGDDELRYLVDVVRVSLPEATAR